MPTLLTRLPQDDLVGQTIHFGETTLHRLGEPDFFVGWGTLALLNAGVAQGKNRSGLGWFLISLFLGPIATFLLVAFCGKLPEG
jgi:hypothetical protein